MCRRVEVLAPVFFRLEVNLQGIIAFAFDDEGAFLISVTSFRVTGSRVVVITPDILITLRNRHLDPLLYHICISNLSMNIDLYNYLYKYV